MQKFEWPTANYGCPFGRMDMEGKGLKVIAQTTPILVFVIHYRTRVSLRYDVGSSLEGPIPFKYSVFHPRGDLGEWPSQWRYNLV